MKSVQIQLTTKCNQRCYMCRKYTWKHREINFDILKEKIEKYKDCTFTFSGGDPLEYSRIGDLAKLLADYKVIYQVFTNMNYELTDEIATFLNNAKCIQVSLDGSNYETYTSVRRPTINGLNKVIGNIEKYAEKIKLNCTVSKRNYFDTKNIYELFNGKVKAIRFFPVHTDDDAKLESYMLDYIKNQFAFEESIPECFNVLFEKRGDYTGKCFVKKEHRIIDESGKEYPCCRAINDNGEDWDGKNCIENLSGIDDENVLYDFCYQCDRYRKFNMDWDKYKNSEEVFL